MHGTTPNTVAVTIAFRRLGEFFIYCSFRETERKEPDRWLDIIGDSRPLDD
jgi:hypothetical protein